MGRRGEIVFGEDGAGDESYDDEDWDERPAAKHIENARSSGAVRAAVDVGKRELGRLVHYIDVSGLRCGEDLLAHQIS